MTRRLKQRLVLAFQIGFVILLILGMIVGRILVKRSQDNRQQASGNCVGFFEIPNVASLSAKINDTSIDLCPLAEGSFHLVATVSKTSGPVADMSLANQTTSPKTEGQIFTHIFQCQQANVTEITLTVERVGSPGVWTHIHTCGAVSASIAPTPTPTATPVPQVCTNTNADIVFIIDRSDSMNDLESGKKKIDWVKEAAQNVVNTYGARSGGKIRFGVVVFGMKGVASSSTDIYVARTLSAISNNYSQVNQTLSGITGTDSGTCIECGLRLANTELEKSPAGTARVAILLSDGGATYTWDKEQDRPKAIANAYAVADYGRSVGIRYVTARYGSSSVGDAVMSTIAGSTGFYSYKPTTQEWSTALAGLGEQICKAAPNIGSVTQATAAPTLKSTPAPTPTPMPITISSTVSRTTQTLSVATPTPTPLLLALAQSTPTPTPVPTPTPTAVPACSSACTTSAQCPTSMICSGNICRNPSCLSSTTCVCPTASPTPTPSTLALVVTTPTPTPVPTPTPTPVPQCNSNCATSATCPSGMSCYLGICRTTACQSSSSCLCTTPTPIATATPVTIAQTSSNTTTTTTTQTLNSTSATSATALDPRTAPISGSTETTLLLIAIGTLLIFSGIFLFL